MYSLCVCVTSPSLSKSHSPPEEKSGLAPPPLHFTSLSPAFSSISSTLLRCSCSITLFTSALLSRIFHFVSCCHFPHHSLSFFFFSLSLFLFFLKQSKSTCYHFWSNFLTLTSLGFLVVDDHPPQKISLTYHLPQVDKMSSNITHHPLLAESHPLSPIYNSFLSFIFISNTSPTLQWQEYCQLCKKSLTFTVLAVGCV